MPFNLGSHELCVIVSENSAFYDFCDKWELISKGELDPNSEKNTFNKEKSKTTQENWTKTECKQRSELRPPSKY